MVDRLRNNCGIQRSCQTPLQLALELNNSEMVKLLIRYEADVSTLSTDEKNHLDILIKKNEPGTTTFKPSGATLIRAMSPSNINIVNHIRMLVAKGTEINYNYGGESPLSRAVSNGDIEMVNLLLELGADANFETINAPLSNHSVIMTPLKAAIVGLADLNRCHEDDDIEDKKNKIIKLIKILIDNGADLDFYDPYRRRTLREILSNTSPSILISNDSGKQPILSPNDKGKGKIKEQEIHTYSHKSQEESISSSKQNISTNCPQITPLQRNLFKEPSQPIVESIEGKPITSPNKQILIDLQTEIIGKDYMKKWNTAFFGGVNRKIKDESGKELGTVHVTDTMDRIMTVISKAHFYATHQENRGKENEIYGRALEDIKILIQKANTSSFIGKLKGRKEETRDFYKRLDDKFNKLKFSRI